MLGYLVPECMFHTATVHSIKRGKGAHDWGVICHSKTAAVGVIKSPKNEGKYGGGSGQF